MSWVLPFASYYLPLAEYLPIEMMSRIGGMGNAMSFGKSNARIYVEAQTGISFDDVAGQDEAKEALSEVVDFLHNPAKYKEIGAKIPKGVLLGRSSGNGQNTAGKGGGR
jgi:cell division protease FtsH